MLIDFEEVKHKLNNSKWYGTQAWYEILDIIGDCDDKSRPKGEWVDIRCEDFTYQGTCSVCGRRNDIPHPLSAKYCPNCGADMRGEK